MGLLGWIGVFGRTIYQFTSTSGKEQDPKQAKFCLSTKDKFNVPLRRNIQFTGSPILRHLRVSDTNEEEQKEEKEEEKEEGGEGGGRGEGEGEEEEGVEEGEERERREGRRRKQRERGWGSLRLPIQGWTAKLLQILSWSLPWTSVAVLPTKDKQTTSNNERGHSTGVWLTHGRSSGASQGENARICSYWFQTKLGNHKGVNMGWVEKNKYVGDPLPQ